MQREAGLRRLMRVGTVVGAVAVIAAILWIDISTGVWQEVVILSGLAAGLVSFLLTVLVLDRIVARSTARRWAPVNRLALTEFLHAIADDRSEIVRGHVLPRSLPRMPEPVAGEQVAHAALERQLHDLRRTVVQERKVLSRALGSWAEFLSANGDNDRVLRHVANIALQLDAVRDATLELEGASETDETGVASLNREIDLCNAHLAALVDELRALLTASSTRRTTAYAA